MKKIALFISSLQKGGSERVMVNLAEYFYNKNYEVLLVTQYKREVEYEINPAIKRVYSETEEHLLQGGRIRNFVTRFQTLRNIWKEYQPDVILSFLGKNNLMAVITAMGLPTKVAVSVRGEPTMEYVGKTMQMIAKLVFGFADGIIMQTKMACEFLPGYLHKKAVVLSNPLNPVFLNARYTGEKENLIVAAGRLDENKNHAMLIEAFSKIADEFPKMKVIIYGEGESRKELEQLIEEKGLHDKVSLPGSTSHISEKVGKARVFVLTSNTEGMPNSIMEAMALGVPVISTDCPCGGPATLIEQGVNGMLVPVNDANALAEALTLVLSDEQLEKQLGENAYQITNRLHPDKVNAEWETYLQSL